MRKTQRSRFLSNFFIVGTAILSLAVVVWMAIRLVPLEPKKLRYVPQTYVKLPGWASDDQAAALKTFLVSCTRMSTKPQTLPEGERIIWGEICAAGRTVPEQDNAAARSFFETHFVPYSIRNGGEDEGLLTGYYEPELRGSRVRDDVHTVPLYRLPPELLTADLGAFMQDMKGRTLVGRMEGNRILPYYERADIAAGVLSGRNLELMWVDDAVAAFFLEVQGSGRVVLPDGSLQRVGYAGKNGRAYTAIGKVLVDRGAIAKTDVSLFTIRDWLKAHPDQAAEVMNENGSYVFFQEYEGDGPYGSEGTVLTPGRSLAVDRSLIPMGAPIYIAGSLPQGGGLLQRLMVAQDTGGAITGPMRGDVFWGPGGEAEYLAGHMKDKARFYLLWPRALPVRS